MDVPKLSLHHTVHVALPKQPKTVIQLSQIEQTVKSSIFSHSKPEVSYYASQMFCFEYTVF